VSVQELLEWQWSGYARYHTSRTNLLLHIVVVPLFIVATVGLLVSFLLASWGLFIASLGSIVVSVAMQGLGHRIESVPPVPFTSAGNAISRILLEQWVTFPRFVVSGGWLRALRQAAP
jgi:hypothetical protein